MTSSTDRGRSSLAGQTLRYTVARGAPGIINLLSILVYTRLVPPPEYGRYALVVAAAVLGRSILFQWLGAGVLRFLPRYRHRRVEFLSTVKRGFLLAVVASLPILVMAIVLLPGDWPRILVISGFALLWASAWFELNIQLANAEGDAGRYGRLSVARAAISLATGTLLALAGAAASGLVAGLILGSILPVLRSTRLRAGPPRDDGPPARAVSGDADGVAPGTIPGLLAYGLPLSGTLALGFVLNSADRLLLGGMVDSEAAGLYAVGYDLARQPLALCMVVASLAGYPLVVSTLEDRGLREARERLKRYLVVLVALALPATVALIVLANPIAHTLLDASYAGSAAELIPWIACGTLAWGLKVFYADFAFQLAQRTVVQFVVAALAAALNLSLNVLWIPQFGFMGAAYANLVAYACALGLAVTLGRRSFPLPSPGAGLLKVGAATLGMTTLLALGDFGEGLVPLTASVAMGAASYVALLLLLDLGNGRRIVARLWRSLVNSDRG